MALRTSRIVFALMLFAAAMPAHAAVMETPRKEFTAQEKERILLPCKRATPERRIRCEVQELKRAEAEWGKSKPMNAYEVYDWMDLGGHHLRNRLQQERLQTFSDHWEQTRKVYSAFEPADDVNTQRLPYVNAIRESHLDCMYVRHGRPRTLCLEAHKDASQKMMRTPQQ